MRLFPRLIAEEVGEEWGGRIRSLAPEVAPDVYWNVLECTGMFWRLQRVGGNLSPTNSAKRMTC